MFLKRERCAGARESGNAEFQANEIRAIALHVIVATIIKRPPDLKGWWMLAPYWEMPHNSRDGVLRPRISEIPQRDPDAVTGFLTEVKAMPTTWTGLGSFNFLLTPSGTMRNRGLT
jgi:hypothetical protein